MDLPVARWMQTIDGLPVVIERRGTLAWLGFARTGGFVVDITIDHAKDPATSRVAGEADADNCHQLGAALLDLPATTTALEVDLSGLSFIDSSAISELLRIKRELETREVRFVLTDPSDAVFRVLEITGLLDVFGLTPRG